LPSLASSEGMLLLDRDLLDQQIIDVHGRKVVRVNDAMLMPETGNLGVQLRMGDVEVGPRGALRRLLKGLIPRNTVDAVTERLTPRAIPWQFVNLIETDPARRVRLRIDQQRLAKLHPADIADILEDLAPAEREAVFGNLEEDVAAETLEELDDPRLQASLLSSVGHDQAADIVEEMDPDAAADVLAEMTPEQSGEILREMEPEEREEVSELLSYRENTAAGRMTTDFFSIRENLTGAEAVAQIQRWTGPPEMLNTLFLLDEFDRLSGMVPLTKLMLAPASKLLSELKQEPLVYVGPDASEADVAEVFDKYNLLMLPVVEEDGTVAGVITADDVISLLRRKV
jgi:magnesium transporter